ncbi:MAG: MmgE/PrpD family protein, partial [Oscillospiraceae bacterium]|nr:MmgE/PrpD family protein [Oscillospiraceae bacterium]
QKTYTKPYASCRYTHPSVEAAIRLRDRYGIKAEEIKQISIKTYSLAVSGHDHTDIPNSYSAKMSIPYSTAVGLIFGKAGLQEFSEENVKRKDIDGLVKKINVSSDDDLSRAFPEIQPAVVNIETSKGNFSIRVDFPKGEPENPLSSEEFRERYDGLMKYAGIDAAVSDGVFSAVSKLGSGMREILSRL